MKSVSVIVLLALCCISENKAENLTIGNSVGATLTYLENIKLSAIPLATREKNVFFSSEKNQIIRAITARDLDNSTAKAIVTSGGVGSTFVNVRMKSSRGKGLNYQVMIFV